LDAADVEGVQSGTALSDYFSGDDLELLQGCLTLRLKLDERARRILRSWVLTQDAAESAFAAGWLWSWLGRADFAERGFAACLDKEPFHPRANAELGLLLLAQERFDEAISCFGRALQGNPRNALLHHDLGISLLSVGEPNDALSHLKLACSLDPTRDDIKRNLFNVAVQLGQLEIARETLDAAISLERSGLDAMAISTGAIAPLKGDQLSGWPAEAEAKLAVCAGEFDRARALYLAIDATDPAVSKMGLGDIAVCNSDFKTAEIYFSDALTISPTDPVSLHNLAFVLTLRGKPAEALQLVNEALKSGISNPETLFLRADLLLRQGFWQEGWAAFEERLNSSVSRWKLSDFQGHPKWAGEDLTGKILVLAGEQGAGDRIQFVRYAAVLAELGAEVLVCCEPALEKLLETVPGVSQVYAGEQFPGFFDYWVPMLSIPAMVGTTESSIPSRVPYLFPEAGNCRAWEERLGEIHDRRIRVGLVWAGNPELSTQAADRRRSIPLDCFAPLWQLDAISFFSLQKGKPRDQLAKFVGEHPMIDYSDDWHDFADTAAFIRTLDLVISVDTSVVHLAGALGIPVWVLSRCGGCWRWLEDREDSPWYPSARIFRQDVPGSWEPVIARVEAALKQLCRQNQ